MKSLTNKQFSFLIVATSAAVWVGIVTVVIATEPVATLQGRKTSVSCIAYSPDGKTLASGNSDNSIVLWDVGSGKERATLEGHKGGVSCVAYAPDGKTLVSASADTKIKLWDAATGKDTATLHGHTLSVAALAISPNGKTLASVGLNLRESYRTEIKLWELGAGATHERMALPDGHNVRSITFNPDGQTLAYGSAEALKLWDISEEKEVPPPRVKVFMQMRSVAFSPDGKLLAYGGGMMNRPSLLRLWDVALEKERFDIAKQNWGLGLVAFSPDGKTLATWSQSYDAIEEINLWDTSTGKERKTVPTKGVNGVAFSPDSKRLAVAEGEAGIWVWDIATDETR